MTMRFHNLAISLGGSIFAALAFVAGAGAQAPSPPDFSGGDGGWAHRLNATFPPVEGFAIAAGAGPRAPL